MKINKELFETEARLRLSEGIYEKSIEMVEGFKKFQNDLAEGMNGEEYIGQLLALKEKAEWLGAHNKAEMSLTIKGSLEKVTTIQKAVNMENIVKLIICLETTIMIADAIFSKELEDFEKCTTMLDCASEECLTISYTHLEAIIEEINELIEKHQKLIKKEREGARCE